MGVKRKKSREKAPSGEMGRPVFMSPKSAPLGLWSRMGERLRSQMRACRARPSTGGGGDRSWDGLAGKAGDDARGGFLGGTHSVRPRCEASPMPRHNMIIGGKRTPGGLMGRSPGKSEVSLAGVRSPPLRGVGYPSWDGLAGKTLG
jgi:hypothetical protein